MVHLPLSAHHQILYRIVVGWILGFAAMAVVGLVVFVARPGLMPWTCANFAFVIGVAIPLGVLLSLATPRTIHVDGNPFFNMEGWTARHYLFLGGLYGAAELFVFFDALPAATRVVGGLGMLGMALIPLTVKMGSSMYDCSRCEMADQFRSEIQLRY